MIRLLLRSMGALSLVLTVIVAPDARIAAQDREQDADDAAATAVELSRLRPPGISTPSTTASIPTPTRSSLALR